MGLRGGEGVSGVSTRWFAIGCSGAVIGSNGGSGHLPGQGPTGVWRSVAERPNSRAVGTRTGPPAVHLLPVGRHTDLPGSSVAAGPCWVGAVKKELSGKTFGLGLNLFQLWLEEFFPDMVVDSVDFVSTAVTSDGLGGV